MPETRQLPLDLPHRPALGRGDFFVSDANALAVAWIDRWPNWPGPVLALHGPPGCGKSHLAEVWCAKSSARRVTAADLQAGIAAEISEGSDCCLVEDADHLFMKYPNIERQVLHLYNLCVTGSRHLLLTGRPAPSRWGVALPDLRSRLAAIQTAALEEPDDALLAAVMMKLFADRQVMVAPEVVRFLVPRVERSFAAMQIIVQRLDRASLAERRRLTVPMARRVLFETPG